MMGAYTKIEFAIQRETLDGFATVMITTEVLDAYKGIAEVMSAVGRELGDTGGKTTIRFIMKLYPGTKRAGEPDVRILGSFTLEILMTNSQINAILYK